MQSYRITGNVGTVTRRAKSAEAALRTHMKGATDGAVAHVWETNMEHKAGDGFGISLTAERIGRRLVVTSCNSGYTFHRREDSETVILLNEDGKRERFVRRPDFCGWGVRVNNCKHEFVTSLE